MMFFINKKNIIGAFLWGGGVRWVIVSELVSMATSVTITDEKGLY